MKDRSSAEKKEILARINAFTYCGFSCRITGNIAYYYKSFVGRDFKAMMQLALFVFQPYFSDSTQKCWFLLSKVSVHFMMYTCTRVNI